MDSAYRVHFNHPRSLTGGHKSREALTGRTLNTRGLTGKTVNAEVFGLSRQQERKEQERDRSKSRSSSKDSKNKVERHQLEQERVIHKGGVPPENSCLERASLSRIFLQDGHVPAVSSFARSSLSQNFSQEGDVYERSSQGKASLTQNFSENVSQTCRWSRISNGTTRRMNKQFQTDLYCAQEKSQSDNMRD